MELTRTLSILLSLTGSFSIGPDGPSQQCWDDAGPPFGDLDYVYHRNTPAYPILYDGTCPPPLASACAQKGIKRAHLEGPVDCGGKGWFCRILDKEGWSNPFYEDRNFAHCSTFEADEKDQDGHCHGSDVDNVYGWWVRDHWFRGYAGTLHCCCDWGKLPGLVNRCDYRKYVSQAALETCRDANEEHNKGYEGTCGAHSDIPFYDPVGKSDQCWSVEYFADPESVPNPNIQPQPTPFPTKQPTKNPTKKPTSPPTKKPTMFPTKKPTSPPTGSFSCPSSSSNRGITSNRGFDWGSERCASGDGCFILELPIEGESKDVGLIPAGKYDVYVRLEAVGDIDIALYDVEDTVGGKFPEGRAVVGWCGDPSNCNFGELASASKETKTYDRQGIEPMTIEYSGYNGQNGNLGDEYIRIFGATTTPLMMRAFAYRTGSAKVTYSWGESQDACCLGTAPCYGSFQQNVAENAILDVGEIPVGKRDVFINLKTPDYSDVDVQLYDLTVTSPFSEGKAIIAWCSNPDSCNIGVMSDYGAQTTMYPDTAGLQYSWTGYNGQNGNLGDESIAITGVTDRPLMMKVFGYTSGDAEVSYSYWNPVQQIKTSRTREATSTARGRAREQEKGRGQRG